MNLAVIFQAKSARIERLEQAEAALAAAEHHIAAGYLNRITTLETFKQTGKQLERGAYRGHMGLPRSWSLN